MLNSNYHGKELLPIKSDIVFKVIFGKSENVDILAKFLEAILDFNLLDSEQFLNRYRYKNTIDHVELSNLCEINFLELKKVPEKCYNDKEMWSLFIATNDEEVIDMLANENQDIKKAVEKLEYVSSDRDERFRIDQIDKARIDHLAENAANREEGFKDGIVIGIERGIEQGIEEGIEQEKIKIAKSLLEVLDDEQISKSTHLTLGEIKKLRNEEI
ncbi:MAG: PD-(D/E)XK nuclease family transposase [Vallitaleaceae bacterium]|jgi:predicted transposase/invertase (TIGR01784 family)|nr:PD-(D/E)XK nuclease family transposase [Vallitaleaceae bacterium]